MLDQSLRPVKVYFELTNHCNFKCDFCPILVSNRKGHNMDFELYCKGIDEIAAEGITDTVGYHVLGEPLIYPRLADAISYAKSKGLHTEINTNGGLLTPERVTALVESGLDELAISVQLIGEEEHAARGTSLSFADYYQRVLEAIKIIRGSGSQMDLILCFMNKSSHKFFDVEQAQKMKWESLDRKKLIHYILDICTAINKPTSEQQVQQSLQRLNLNRPQMIKLDEHTKVYVHPFGDWGNAFTSKKIHPAHFGTCSYALSNLGVLSSGEITICCPDYDGGTTLGNLNTTTLSAVLTSPRAYAIRDGFKRNRVVHPHCQHCLGGTNLLKTWLKGAISVYLFKVLKFQPAQVKEVCL